MFFLIGLKQNGSTTPYIRYEVFCFEVLRKGVYMRGKRELAENVWYYVRTAVNDREPLFWSGHVVWLLARVLSEAKVFFGFELWGLRFDGAWVSFYIKPDNGLELPEIVKWIKQTFSVRFNLLNGRTGHIWGDRYWSEILVGEPPEWAERYEFITIDLPVRKGDWRREAEKRGFQSRCGERRCYRMCHGRVGQTLAPTEGENPHVQASSPHDRH
jgi:hypothetical protein